MEPEEGNRKEDFIKWFSEIEKSDLLLVGTVGESLGEMSRFNVPLPPGFVITTSAYRHFLESSGGGLKINMVFEDLDYKNHGDLEKKAEKIKEIILGADLPENLSEEILEAYENLDAESNVVNAIELLGSGGSAPVSIRPSFTPALEDLKGSDYSVKARSFVNIAGKENVLETVKKCFASAYAPKSLAFLSGQKNNKNSKVAVIVQKMVDAEKSGTVITKDPRHGNNLYVEAVFGLGKKISREAISPDRYTVSRADSRILEKDISEKKAALVPDSENGMRKVNLSPEKSREQVLSSYDISILSDLSLKIEECFKVPQKIKFAAENGKFFVIQSRPLR